MDDVDELLKSVMAALDLSDPSVEEKLRKGLARGLEMASEGGTFEFDLEMEATSPDVVVLDGGLEEGAPSTGRPPDLAVVDGTGEDRDVQVRVVRQPFASRSVPRSRSSDGTFEVTDATATLFRGLTPHCYRVFCDEGPLALVMDGTPAETLTTGCSIDVEAAFLQIRGTGRGSYRRL